MRSGLIRRSLAAASATVMAGAALVVGGAGVASAEPVSKTGEVTGNSVLGNRLEFKRTVSEREVTHGDTVTITSEIIDSYGSSWFANTHSWIENNTPECLDYVEDTARWRAWPNTDFETPTTKPGEFKPSANAIRIGFPVRVSDPLVLEADYVVKCDAGNEVATGGMSWRGTYGSSDDNFKNFGPAIKVNRASVSQFFLAAPSALEVNEAATLTVDTNAPEGSDVIFEVDGQSLPAKVSGGKATATWTPSSAGTQTVTATLQQTGTHLGKSTQRTVSVAEQTVDSTLTINAPTDAQVGVVTQLSATVLPEGAGGTVTFTEQGEVIDSVPVPASGVVTVDWIPAAEGQRSIDAIFSGRTGVNGSTAIGKSVTVAPKAADMQSSTTTVSPVEITELGGTVVLTATVDPVAGGTVSFYDGATLIETVDVDANGVATYSWTPETEGERTVRAAYSGAGTVLPSAGTTTVVISSSSDTPEPGDPLEPGTPSDNSGSLGSLTGSLGS